LPPAAALFNVLAAAMSFLMVQASSVVAALPGSSIAVEPWSWSGCLAWYGTASALVFLLVRVRRRQFAAWWLPNRSETGASEVFTHHGEKLRRLVKRLH
jgi:hypothetical protein